MSAMWRYTLPATVLIAVMVGSRSALGLYVSPIGAATGIGLAGISLAAAVGQLGQGIAQPVVGLLADRYGAFRIILSGALVYSGATALLTLAQSALALGAMLLVAAVAGTAMASIAVLLGEVCRHVPAQRQAMAIGIVGAGGSTGQLLIGPATQIVIDLGGWQWAMLATASLGLLAVPLSLVFRRPPAGRPAPRLANGRAADLGVGQALRQPSFWLIAVGFGVCGFHVSFLTMHMPGVIERSGLPASLAGHWLAVFGFANIVASISASLLLRRWQPAVLLVVLNVLRALFIAALAVLPPTPAVLLAFAAAMGLTFMSVLPPTSMLISTRFGTAPLASLFGVAMLVHQAGGFAGVWLGGLAAESDAGYRNFWLADGILALIAAVTCLPSCRPRRPAVAAAMASSSLHTTWAAAIGLPGRGVQPERPR